MEALSATGTVIFLDRSVEEICGSDLSGRPLIGKDLNRVQALYDQRIGLYRRYARDHCGEPRCAGAGGPGNFVPFERRTS